MDGQVLSLRALNRATLARQMLLERANVSTPDAVRRMAAVQAQHPAWPGVGLWSRLRAHAPADLRDALARREVVRASLMRITLHVVHAADYWPCAAVTRPMRENQFRLMYKEPATDPAVLRRLRPAHEAALAALAEAPRSMAELRDIMSAALPVRAARDTQYLWRHFAATVPLVDVPPPGGEARYGRSCYVTAAEWLGPAPDGSEDRHSATALLFERYLAAYGPASRDDIVGWIGRLSAAEAKAAIAHLGERLTHYRDEGGRELFDLADAPRPGPDVVAPVRLLARWDSLLLAHGPKFRTRILPAEHHAAVNRPNGDVLPTFLVDGFVAGTWTYEPGGARSRPMIELRPFQRLRATHRAELEAEAKSLGEFLGLADAEVRYGRV